jgi:hypothetical protein
VLPKLLCWCRRNLFQLSRLEVKTCLTSASAANHIPTRSYSKNRKRWKSLNAYHQRNERYLRRYGSHVMDYPSRDSDLVTSNFHSFGPLMKHVTICQFTTNPDAKQAVIPWLKTLDKCFSTIWYKSWYLSETNVCVSGSYREVCYLPSATQYVEVWCVLSANQ